MLGLLILFFSNWIFYFAYLFSALTIKVLSSNYLKQLKAFFIIVLVTFPVADKKQVKESKVYFPPSQF